MLGLQNGNLILYICEFDINCNKKGSLSPYRVKKNIGKFIFFKPPHKFVEISKTTRVLKFKEFTPKII